MKRLLLYGFTASLTLMIFLAATQKLRSPSAMPTFTYTATLTATWSPTATPTRANTLTATQTLPAVLTKTSTPTGTPTPIGKPNKTSTPIDRLMPTATPTMTSTPTNTLTPTATPTMTSTPTDTLTPIATPTLPSINFGPPDGIIYTPPDGTVLSYCSLSPLITNHRDAGYDFVYYEKAEGSGISMDQVIIEVGDGSIWYQVFNWGDGSPDINSNLNMGGPEPDNANTSSVFLINGTGIGIDLYSLGLVNSYSCLRITAPVGGGDGIDVDAIDIFP